MMKLIRASMFVLVMAVLMSSGVALAQSGHARANQNNRPVMVLPKQIVKGTRHEPQVVYLMPRSNVRVRQPLTKSFVPNIVRTVDGATF